MTYNLYKGVLPSLDHEFVLAESMEESMKSFSREPKFVSVEAKNVRVRESESVPLSLSTFADGGGNIYPTQFISYENVPLYFTAVDGTERFTYWELDGAFMGVDRDLTLTGAEGELRAYFTYDTDTVEPPTLVRAVLEGTQRCRVTVNYTSDQTIQGIACVLRAANGTILASQTNTSGTFVFDGNFVTKAESAEAYILNDRRNISVGVKGEVQ